MQKQKKSIQQGAGFFTLNIFIKFTKENSKQRSGDTKKKH